jgi:hypothetical protein
MMQIAKGESVKSDNRQIGLLECAQIALLSLLRAFYTLGPIWYPLLTENRSTTKFLSARTLALPHDNDITLVSFVDASRVLYRKPCIRQESYIYIECFLVSVFDTESA